VDEDGCAILQAVAEGKINEDRHATMCAFCWRKSGSDITEEQIRPERLLMLDYQLILVCQHGRGSRISASCWMRARIGVG